MRILLVLAGLALLAGCTHPAANAPSTTPGPTLEPGLVPRAPANDVRPELAHASVRPDVTVAKTTLGGLGGGPGAAEPNLAVGPDGTLYAANPCAIWRSSDNGTTWKETAHKGQTGCGDGDIAVDSAGNVYWLGLVGPGVSFQASNDRGETFGKPVDISNKSAFDREWIDATPDGHLYTAWRGSKGMEFRSSHDGGLTWGARVVAGPDGDGGPVTHDSTSRTLYLPVVDQADTTGTTPAKVHVYVSRDEGATWTVRDTATFTRTSPVEPNGYVSDFPVTAVDTNGTVYLVYSADATGLPGVAPPEGGSRYGIWMQVSHDAGANWTKPALLSTPGKDARMPWIAAGKPGRVAVAWYENVVGTPGESVPDEWNVHMWESVTADQATPVGQTLSLTATPNHVGSLCTSGTGCVAGGDRSLLDFFEVAIDTAGQPIAVWSASVGGTGVGVAAQGTDIHFGGLTGGTPLV